MNENIVLVTGMSGAGKSSAMNALEDLGYYCIDNFPKELLPQLETLLKGEPEKYQATALSVSAMDYIYFVKYFDTIAKHLKIIFLDCSDHELLLRYRFTRRQHPMISFNYATTLEEAIEMERDYFDHLQENAQTTIHLDTTKLTPQKLVERICHRFKMNKKTEFTITFQSFGFKHGVPMDADAIIDVRFLPNPFYEPSLRNKTGNQEEVYKYVMSAQETQDYVKTLKKYLDITFENYKNQCKSHMIVAIGCTGGQHRSVSICNWLFDEYKSTYRCFKSHRDINNEEFTFDQ